MERYTIYCTEEQTKKAFALGAPIDESIDYHTDGHLITTGYMLNGEVNDKNLDGFGWANILRIPTAEQMIGWLEEQGVVVILVSIIDIDTLCYRWVIHSCQYDDDFMDRSDMTYSRKDATLAAIDAALDYLIKNKK